MDVDLVDVQHDFVSGKMHHQSLNYLQMPLPPRLFPGTFDERFGPLQPNSQPAQELTHRRDADRDTDAFVEHQDEQFLRPRGTPVAELLRRLIDEEEQFTLVSRGDFSLAFVFAFVGETHQAVGDESVGDRIYLRLRAEAALAASSL